MDKIKDFLKPELIWFLIGIALLLGELITPGLIIAFFGMGAFVVAIVCLFADIQIDTQLLIFIGASVLSLVFLRKWVKGIFYGHSSSKQDLSEDMQEYAGQKVVVKEKIHPNIPGKVEFHGTNWLAQADEPIEPGTVVEIVGKENLTLKVKSL